MAPPPEPADALVDSNASKQYWEAVSADNDGMLGGFAFVSRADLRGSRTLLAKLGIGSKPGLQRVARALEGGAGWVREGLLLDVADEVDVIEPVAKFTKALQERPGVRRVYQTGLQDWVPEADEDTDSGDDDGRYGLIWTQWCAGYLKDDQLVAYLQRCRRVLAPGGLVVVKENITTTGEDDYDSQDSSVTRADRSFQAIFAEAGYRLVRAELQRGFPPEAGLLPVKMYALKPV